MADDDVDQKVVKEYIANGFLMAPVKYNGEDATEAMEANRAPQNLIHDGYTNGYIKDDTTVRLAHTGGRHLMGVIKLKMGYRLSN